MICSKIESLTKRDIIEVLPFGNQADIIELKGEHLLAALEHSVSTYNPKAPSGQFLQMSGKYSYSSFMLDVKGLCPWLRGTKILII